MLKFTLITLALVAFQANGQYQLQNTTWITKYEDQIKFMENNMVNISDLDFASSFEVKGDTLHFKHDFSYIISQTIGDVEVPREDFEVPDSYFRLVRVDSDSLTIEALNPAALYVIAKLTSGFTYGTHVDEKDIITWEKTGVKPQGKYGNLNKVITFFNINTIKKERDLVSFSYSSKCESMISVGYFDLIIDSQLNYYCRTISHGYNKNSPRKFTYYKGKLNQNQLDSIEVFYAYSNLPDTGQVGYNRIFASHDSYFTAEITNNIGKMTMSGTRMSLPDYLDDFIDAITNEVPMSKDQVKQLTVSFPLTSYGKPE